MTRAILLVTARKSRILKEDEHIMRLARGARASVLLMSNLINEALRAQVALRADHLCEYCLIDEEDCHIP
jgi:hypothetical protein